MSTQMRLGAAASALLLTIAILLAASARADDPGQTALLSTTAYGSPDQITVLFSPNGGCTDRIVDEIDSAKKRLRVMAYIFTSREIAKAIISAHKRGVECTVVADKGQSALRYSQIDYLRKSGVTVHIDGKHSAANNKVILIDDRAIITGSFNYTKAAEEKNAENLIIITGRSDLFKEFKDNFDEHLAHSKKTAS